MLDDDVEAFPILAAMEGGYHGHDGVRRWWASLFALEVAAGATSIGSVVLTLSPMLHQRLAGR